MTCVKAESHVQCMYYIDQAGKGEAVGADVVVLDAGDIYRSVSRNLAQLITQPRNNPIGLQGRLGVRADPDHGGDLQPGDAALLRRGRRPPEGQLL